MIARKIVYLVLIFLSLSLASAVNVSTDKSEYSAAEIVTASIDTCSGTSIAKFQNPDDRLVDLKSGQDNWSTTYHTSSDPSKGKYTLSISCSNGLAQANFCVDAPGCLAENEVCTSDWDCGLWSSCGTDQLERRTCTDKNNCAADKEETRACSVCQESWSCLSWSACQGGLQTRTCYDQNNCGSILNKPADQQACQEIAQQPTPTITEPVTEESFFSKNMGLIIAVVLAAILLVVGLLYYFKWKGKEMSFAEVREWIGLEREKGTSDEDMRISLQKRGWEEKDIKAAFKKSK